MIIKNEITYVYNSWELWEVWEVIKTQGNCRTDGFWRTRSAPESRSRAKKNPSSKSTSHSSQAPIDYNIIWEL
jgi:hypothetical protein